jgi:undecaprenyl-phosphate galactose phosphotransferase
MLRTGVFDLMSVVDRLPRNLVFESDRRRGRAAASGLADSGTAAGGSGAWCAAGLILADSAAFGLAVAAGLLAVPALASFGLGGAVGSSMQDPLLWLILAYAGTIATAAAFGHYDHRCTAGGEISDIVAMTAGIVVVLGFSAFLVGQAVPRGLVLAGGATFMVLAMPARLLGRYALQRAGKWQIPVLVVGNGAWSSAAADGLRQARRLGYEVAGIVSPPAVLSGMSPRPWTQMLAHHGARMVVLAVDENDRPVPGLAASLVRERVPFAIMPQPDGLPVAGCRSTPLSQQDTVLHSYRNNLDKPVARISKVIFDVVVSCAALLVLAPLLVIIAALVSLDGGPVLFGHTRIGARGRVFKCWKFRSMVMDSGAVLNRLLQEDPAAAEEWARTHKLRNDPRVTWIGRLLRKTSLDELPQLFNVLSLDMSLVGPRPIVSLEIPKYGEDIAYYYETRPGITGLWQVSGRSDTTYSQRVRLDTWYVKNWTLWQDMEILCKTIPAVISGRGAG